MSLPVGEIASLAAALCWAIGLNLFLRDVTEIGARAVNLFKGVIGTALFLICVVVVGTEPVPFRAQVSLALSGVVGLALGDTLLFRALGLMGAHRTALFAMLGPVMTAVGGFLLLGETLGVQQVAGVLLAAAGVTMVVYFRGRAPSGPVPLAGILCGVLAAVCQAGGVLFAKHGLREAGALTGTTLRLASATAVLCIVAALRRDLMPDLRRLVRVPVLRRLVPGAFIGTFGGLWLMLLGIKHTESAVASALHSMTPLFTLPIALFWLRDRLGPMAVIGSFVAVAGVTVLLAAGS